MNYIFIVIGITFLAFLTYHQIKIFNFRYLKSYQNEIQDFLAHNNYQFVESRTPNNLDWKNSPFEKPETVKIRLSAFRINGIHVNWTATRYEVITAKNNNKVTPIWLEIETTYLSKPQLKFKFQKD